MKSIAVKAYAKINVTLDITAKRQDGYHELESLMQQVSLFDEVRLYVEEGDSVSVASDRNFVPIGENNIAFRAARELLTFVKKNYKVDIFIKKRIPVAGGMAGGSTNAAAVLVGLDKLLGFNLGGKILREIGLKLGADVPFCVQGGAVIARGIGERLESIKPLPRMWMVLVKPDFGVSTAEVYRNFSLQTVSNRPNLCKVLEGVKNNRLEDIYTGMGNVLEPVTLKLEPSLAAIKETLIEFGARRVMMSGSGPTMIAFTAEEQSAKALARQAESSFPSSYQVVVARTLADKEGGYGANSESK